MLNISELQFAHLQNGDNNRAYLTVFSQELNEMTHPARAWHVPVLRNVGVKRRSGGLRIPRPPGRKWFTGESDGCSGGENEPDPGYHVLDSTQVSKSLICSYINTKQGDYSLDASFHQVALG